MKAPLIEPLESRIAPAVISISAPADSPKNEGSTIGGVTSFDFTVSIPAPEAADINIPYYTIDGTAHDGEDFVGATMLTPGMVTIVAGSTTALIHINVNQDDKFEGDETFTVRLDDQTLASGHSVDPAAAEAAATIQNDDAKPTISIGDAKVNEGALGETKTMTFTVKLSNPADQDITFDWFTSDQAPGDQSATAGTDYVAHITTPVTILKNQTSVTFTVDTVGDNVDEQEEAFFANITNAKLGSTDLVITKGQAFGKIGNDDRLVSIAGSPTTVEGNSGEQGAQFTVSLTEAAPYDIFVSFKVAGVGALVNAGEDFRVPTDLVKIPANQLSATFTIPILGDTRYELSEQYVVSIDNVINATGDGSTATGTITDNDTPPTVSVLPPDINPTNEGSILGNDTTFNYHVHLSQPSGADVTVDFSTQETGSARAADGDFGAVTNFHVTIPAGQTDVLVPVSVHQDKTYEGDETLFVSIANPTNATLANATAQAVIHDDDALPTLSINPVAASITEGDSGTKTFDFVVTLSNPASFPVTFDWATAAGTAFAGSDFVANSATGVTIPAGATTATLHVQINGDGTDEFDETFFANISNAKLNGNVALGVTKAQGAGLIVNDDVTVSIDNSQTVIVTEGDTGTKDAVFTVSIPPSQISEHPITVYYTMVEGTAKLGTDLGNAATGSVIIPAHQTSANIVVKINGDLIFDQSNGLDETYSVRLDKADNAVVGTALANGAIHDNELPPNLKVSNATIAEGDNGSKVLNFIVSIDTAAGQDLTFTLNTLTGGADGTATAGSDFTGMAGATYTILAGQKQVSVPITILGDVIYEQNETFSVQISNASFGSIAPQDGRATVTIQNDEALPTLSIADVSIAEGGPGETSHLTFTVTATRAADVGIEFDWATLFGTATPNGAGADYTNVASQHETFDALSLTKTFTVDILGDATDEPDEAFFVNIANATVGGTALVITDSQAVGKILNDDLSVKVIGPGTVTEGDTGTTDATFTLHLNNPSTHDVFVTFDLIEGTAKLNTDYQKPGSLTVKIPAGMQDVLVAVPIIGDHTFEPNESFTFKLLSATGSVIDSTTANNTVVTTITDNDAKPTISITGQSIEEGDSNTHNVTFTVTLSNPASQDITFHWKTVDGTAVATTGDYTAVGDTVVTIPAGSLTPSTPLTVTVNGDTIDERDEQFTVELSAPKLADGTSLDTTLGGQLIATGGIDNDDTTVRISGGQITEGDAGTATLNFAVSLLQPSTHEVVVHLQLNNGTAVAGQDYQIPATLDVTIPAGQTSVNVPVAILGDTLNEANETFTAVILSADHAKLGVASATGTILDNDAPPTVSINSVTVAEGNTGTTDMTFTVHLSGASGQPVTVLVSPQSGTATSGVDFATSPSTITFQPGETDKVFVVKALGDNVFEPDETFNVVLSNPSGATLGTASGVGTITNDDATPTLSIGDVSQDEGSGGGNTVFNFTVNLSGPADQPVTVDLATADGTALAGTDYIAKTQTLTIPAGQTSATFSVNVKQDALFENTEQFFVNLSNAKLGGVALANPGDTQAVVTINNDDTQPTLKIDDVTVVEGDTGTKQVEFTVTLSAAAGDDVTFDWSTVDGSATSGATAPDFVAVTGAHVTIPAGQTTAKIKVTVNGDTVGEPDENFFVNLTNAKFGTTDLLITDAQAVGKLLNDDVALSIGDVTVNEGDSGETDAVFTVTLTGTHTDYPVTVYYHTQDGSAVSTGATADFTGQGDTLLTFAPGVNTQTITVKVKGDQTYDETDLFKVILSDVTNGRIADGEATGTILDTGATSGTLDAKPTVSVTGVTRLENADGADVATTKFDFVLTLDHASDDTVTVTFNTIDGTAKAATDYTAIANQQVTFAPGTTTQTVSVTVKNDHLFENEETFGVVLSDPAAATLDAAHFQATGTIQGDSDDVKPTLKITNQQIIEGDSGEKFMTFTVQKIGDTEADVKFDFATVVNGDDTAAAGTDFVSVSDHFTIAAGETSKTIQVKILGDTADETNETFTAKITPTDGATLAAPADGLAKGTILNDDLKVSFVQTGVAVAEGNTGQTDLVFVAQLSAVSSHPVTITYNVAPGTATMNTDFQPTTPMQVTIPAGQLTAEIRIPVQGDVTAESDETFTVNLLSATDAVLAPAGTTATGTILNDDAAISIANATIVEGNSGTRNMVFTVTLEDATVFPVTVHFHVGEAATGYDATSGTDFGGAGAILDGDITFNASDVVNGVATKQISVPIIGDTLAEGDEKFLVRLSSPTANGVPIDGLLKSTADGLIQDDESFLSVNDVTIHEGDNGTSTATFTITRSPSAATAATVKVSTLDGTAISTGGAPDFDANTQTVTFASGETTKTFSVTIHGDRVFEAASETFKVILSDATGAVIVDGEGVGTIDQSADVQPTVSVGDATIVEGDSGQKLMEFTVTLSAASGSDVTFNAKTVDGTAGAGGDYLAQVLTNVVIPAGQTSVKVQVPILGDTMDEANENLFLDIDTAKTNGTTLSITRGHATGTILNDDNSVSIAATASVVEGNDGTPTHLLIPVTLAHATNHNTIVTYVINGGTATAGSDYTTPTTLEVTIPANATTANIDISVKGDLVYEGNETINVSLVSATDMQLGAVTTSVGTITENDPVPTVTISDATVTEGNSASFTVTLSEVAAKDIVIKWTTLNGTAIGGDGGTITSTQGDFKKFPTEQTLTIPAGSKTGTIVVPTVNDTIDEGDETFQVQIKSPGAQPGDPDVVKAGTATIGASDLSTFAISDSSVVEGDSGTKQMVFTVTRTGSATLTSTVHYATANGTALDSAGDFAELHGDLVFAPGEVTKTISVTVNGDTLSEVDETMFVTLSLSTDPLAPSNATITDNSGLGTIYNDEATYKLVRVSPDPLTEETAAGAQQFAEYKVVRTGALNVQGAVSFTTFTNDVAGAVLATAGTDYTTTSGTIQFPVITDPSVTSQESATHIRVPITSDALPEGDETFKIKLTTAVNGQISTVSGDAESIVTIQDNDADKLPLVTIADAHISEGNSGTKDLVFTVKLVAADGTTARPAGGPITVTYSTLDGTALGGIDFTKLTDATVTFNAGETSKEIHVPILGDTDDEPDETFQVKLQSASFAVPGSSADPLPVHFVAQHDQATGTIQNDDLAISVTSVVAEAEGNTQAARTFTISIPQASTHEVSFFVHTKDGTAIAGTDYVSRGNDANGPIKVTIPAGQTSATFTVDILGDTYFESDETFSLEFSDAANATLASTSFTATIQNDDAKPSLSIGDATIVEGDNGSQTLVFRVTLAGSIQENVTFDYTTVEGTAKSSGALIDFAAQKGSITFKPTDPASRDISITVYGDTWRELDEHFSVQLSNAKLGTSADGVTISKSSGDGAILDNGDTTLGVIVHDAQVVEGHVLTAAEVAQGVQPAKLSFVIETTAPVTGQALTFNASTRFGTAKADDFTGFTGQSFSIAVGSSSVTVPVTVTGDPNFETSEFLFLDVKGLPDGVKGVGGSAAVVSGRGVILNDDIHVISTRQFEYVDTDGDLVNVRFTKGALATTINSQSIGEVTFVAGGSVGGQFLQRLNLANDGLKFAGTDIIVTAHPQVLATGQVLGDGRANIGAIDAAIPSSGSFQFTSGIQLGKVVVPGDLGRIIAGNVLRPAGISELVVGSLGTGSNLPDSNAGGAAQSIVLGPIGKMTVNGDVSGTLVVLGDSLISPFPNGGVGRIGTLVVKGKLKALSETQAGQIAFTGGIGSATLGGIEGGSTSSSGSIFPLDTNFGTRIGSLTVLGDIKGGTGANSGYVNATQIGAVTIGHVGTRASDPSIVGNVLGGTGAGSGLVVSDSSMGAVTVNGNVTGGTGVNSGSIRAALSIKTLTVTGSLVGGAGTDSGEIRANATIGKVSVGGDLHGGDRVGDDVNDTNATSALRSGSLLAGTFTSSVTISGSIIGGTGANSGNLQASGASLSGRVSGNLSSLVIGKAGVTGSGNVTGGGGSSSGFVNINGSIAKMTVYGDIHGGTAFSTGGILVGGTLGTAVVKGSLIGGGTSAVGTTGTTVPNSLKYSGFIQTGNIANLIIEGRIESGTNLGTSLIGSGSIASFGTIASLQVLGKGDAPAILGNKTNAVVISARDGIGKATFGDDVTFGEILAGFTPDSTTARGTLANAGATIGTITVNGAFSASSISAGVDAGGDGKFGTSDDQQQIAGGTPTNQNLISRIASVILKSVVASPDAPNDASFGITAERVDSVKINGVAAALTAGPHNDSILLEPAAAKLNLQEI